MIDAALYDPEGTIPLVMEIESNDDGIVKRKLAIFKVEKDARGDCMIAWACLQCSGKAEQELKGDI